MSKVTVTIELEVVKHEISGEMEILLREGGKLRSSQRIEIDRSQWREYPFTDHPWIKAPHLSYGFQDVRNTIVRCFAESSMPDALSNSLVEEAETSQGWRPRHPSPEETVSE